MKIKTYIAAIVSVICCTHLSYGAIDESNEKSLDAIIIPKIEFSDATLPDICDYLTMRSRQLDPQHIGVEFTYEASMNDMTDFPITCSFKDIPVLSLAETLAQLLDARFSVDGNKITFYK
jgi:hypothetical protein